MITKTTKTHKEDLQKVLTESGQFDADSIAYTLETLDNHLENPDGEIWFTALKLMASNLDFRHQVAVS
jgi:hypothetical protein